MKTRTNVTLQNNEHGKLSNKFMEKKPALSSKSVSNSTSKLINHNPHLLRSKEYVKKLTTTNMVNPYLLVSTADTGAQFIILGHKHLNKVGLNIS